MKLRQESRDVDLIIKSVPWTDEELVEFRNVMKRLKARNAKRKARSVSSRTRNRYARRTPSATTRKRLRTKTLA
jgi:hypothetical protein